MQIIHISKAAGQELGISLQAGGALDGGFGSQQGARVASIAASSELAGKMGVGDAIVSINNQAYALRLSAAPAVY